MTHISPTRVSIYDFLYEDTLPLAPLLADISHLSIPQATLALSASLQAIISALLAFQHRYDGHALLKKLLTRSSIKDLRQYNSMNFVTINAAVYHRQSVTDGLFANGRQVLKASEYIGEKISANPKNVYILLSTLCVITLRELAILADYAQLNGAEIDEWLALQPQFLAKLRFEQSVPHSELIIPPAFDEYWYQLLNITPPQPPKKASTQATDGLPHYAKVIGRSADNANQSKHDDLLVFESMPHLHIPHQRWLLQLAKISDIYLSRNRLKIASEPTTPPSRPLVSLGLLGNPDTTPNTASDTPIKYDAPKPLWKNPVIVLIVLVIGSLTILATLKYQAQQAQRQQQAQKMAIEARKNTNNDNAPQDVAIVRVEDGEAGDADEQAAKPTAH